MTRHTETSNHHHTSKTQHIYSSYEEYSSFSSLFPIVKTRLENDQVWWAEPCSPEQAKLHLSQLFFLPSICRKLAVQIVSFSPRHYHTTSPQGTDCSFLSLPPSCWWCSSSGPRQWGPDSEGADRRDTAQLRPASSQHFCAYSAQHFFNSIPWATSTGANIYLNNFSWTQLYERWIFKLRVDLTELL